MNKLRAALFIPLITLWFIAKKIIHTSKRNQEFNSNKAILS